MEEDQILPEETSPKSEEVKAKQPLQILKESWYDKVHLSVRQLDFIIVVCWLLLIATGVLIYLDAKDIFHLFG